MSDEPVQAGDTPSSPVGDPPSHAPRFLLLNAIFPGLGHLAAGRWKWALLLGGPLLILLLALVLVRGDERSDRARGPAVRPGGADGDPRRRALVVGWRLFAVGATRVITPITARATTIAALAISVLIVLGPQLVIAGLTVDARDAATEVFAPVAEGGAWVPTETAPPVEPNDPDFAADPSASPDGSLEPSPSPTATPAVPRVNVLLIGMDSGVGRTTALTDTMIIVSLDPVAKTVSMASIPRDMVDVPLPDGRKYRGKINGLVSYARWHPNKFPGSKDGQSVLTAALGTLVGMKIDYWAQVNLGGFVYAGRLGRRREHQRHRRLLRSRATRSTGSRASTSRPAATTWTARRRSGTRVFARRSARATSRGTAASRRSSPRSATGSSGASSWTTRPGSCESLGQTITTNIKPSLIADYIAVATQVKRDDVFRDVFDHPLVKSGYDARGSIQIPDVQADPQEGRQAVPADRHAAERGALRSPAGPGQRPAAQPVEVVDVRAPAEGQQARSEADAEGHAQAHPQADAEAQQDAEADRPADARAAAVRGQRVARLALTRAPGSRPASR